MTLCKPPARHWRGFKGHRTSVDGGSSFIDILWKAYQQHVQQFLRHRAPLCFSLCIKLFLLRLIWSWYLLIVGTYLYGILFTQVRVALDLVFKIPTYKTLPILTLSKSTRISEIVMSSHPTYSKTWRSLWYQGLRTSSPMMSCRVWRVWWKEGIRWWWWWQMEGRKGWIRTSTSFWRSMELLWIMVSTAFMCNCSAY